MLRGDWVFSYEEGKGPRVITEVETGAGDKVIGFTLPEGANFASLLGAMVTAEEESLQAGHKFLVGAVTDPETQVDINKVPENVQSMAEWKERKRNEQAG